jgi:cation transport regulator ChaC
MGNKQMLARCPNSQRLGPAQLPGWRWIIAGDGYANVVPAATDRVEGVLFRLAEADEVALDLFEEVATGAYEKLHLPVNYHGNRTQALVYVGPLSDEGTAAPEYVLRLQAAFADASLDADYLARVVRRFITVAQPGA